MAFPKLSFSRVAVSGVVVVALALAAASGEQDGAATAVKIAVVDTERILLISQMGKKAVADLKAMKEQKEAELAGKAQELNDLQEKITKEKPSLAADKLDELNKQLEEKTIAVRRLADDATREIGKHREEILAKIDQHVMPVINQAGKELGYTAIFRKFESGLIYADDAIDITDAIVQRLDAATAVEK